MPPVEGAATTLLGQWGPAGAIIVALGTALVALFKRSDARVDAIRNEEKIERQEMRAAQAAERAELQRINQQNFEHSVAVSKENTASNRAVEQVLRELTGVIGEIRAQTRNIGG